MGRKLAPYITNVETEKKIVALEIDTGALVSILNKNTHDFNMS